jgi:hypothetical protein
MGAFLPQLMIIKKNNAGVSGMTHDFRVIKFMRELLLIKQKRTLPSPDPAFRSPII